VNPEELRRRDVLQTILLVLDSCGGEPDELLSWLKLSLATFWRLVLVSVGG
jgi:hypothetical protein